MTVDDAVIKFDPKQDRKPLQSMEPSLSPIVEFAQDCSPLPIKHIFKA